MKPADSFINQPIRSLQTMLRTLASQDSRYRSVIPDGIYGPQTMAAVSTLQQTHGLPITGITDQHTWDLLVTLYDPALIRQLQAQSLGIVLNPDQVIRKGEACADLFLIQAMLTVLSLVYESISPPGHSGILDDATSDSIAGFQQLSQLPMTGELDKQTWQQLALQYPLAANRYLKPGKMP